MKVNEDSLDFGLCVRQKKQCDDVTLGSWETVIRSFHNFIHPCFNVIIYTINQCIMKIIGQVVQNENHRRLQPLYEPTTSSQLA